METSRCQEVLCRPALYRITLWEITNLHSMPKYLLSCQLVIGSHIPRWKDAQDNSIYNTGNDNNIFIDGAGRLMMIMFNFCEISSLKPSPGGRQPALMDMFMIHIYAQVRWLKKDFTKVRMLRSRDVGMRWLIVSFGVVAEGMTCQAKCR